MKYILSIFGVVAVCCGIFFCGSKNDANSYSNEDYMRIHITANSNSNKDQNLKYEVKDRVVDFLIPLLAEAKTKDEATQIIIDNLAQIEMVAEDTLRLVGVSYGANISVQYEEIPTRAYDNLVLEEGVYECLNIQLGEGKGDNWWCVVFPAVCFISSKNSENYVYISKIWDIICSVISKS